MKTVKLTRFGFLSIRGKDAVSFLQGYTTCNLDQLHDKTPMLGAICNIKGRMVTNFRVCQLDDGLLLRLDRSLIGKTIAFLAKYIVFSKAEMADMSEIYACYGLMTDREDVIPTPGGRGHLIEISDTRFELWIKQDLEKEFALSDSNNMDPDYMALWQAAEIDDGLAWVDASNSEEYIPQMFNLHKLGGIDFEKGCYLGQEIIARLEFRGQLKRKLHRGTFQKNVKIGDILSSGKPLGAVVNVAMGKTVSALAVLQNATDDPLTVMLEDGESATFMPVA